MLWIARFLARVLRIIRLIRLLSLCLVGVLLQLDGGGLEQWGGSAEKSDKERKVIEGQKEDVETLIGCLF